MRLRLQQVAHLQTRALVSELDADGTAPLHLINLAGGTAIDTLNTLILLNQLRRQALAARNITISVLDIDLNGRQFGAAALRALCAHGSALEGLRVKFVHYPYDWNEPACLAGIVENAIMSGAIVAASSEGTCSHSPVIRLTHIGSLPMPFGVAADFLSYPSAQE
ncbi:hypothetical protein M3A49_11210 [Paraburkholderia sp. CNPSo 3076]|uniref:hypothetical protein n=1 Tax=Paraburkholderia sp. CNPSo 3076 TaxID=2940936 RepID=UPI00224E2655|nr:hypothetical protein [Paraburkholderia sp. CNPSo 3076]MCX5540054.1 hypothetical protein [Paraburkholderia sp. CNPSo 3076]